LEVESAAIDKERRPVKVFAIKQENPLINLDTSRFSKWNRLVRTVGWILRFRSLLVEKRCNPSLKMYQISLKEKYKHVQTLDEDEIKSAEHWLLRTAQLESFPEEVKLLKEGKTVEKASRLYKLSPYYDAESGLVRMKGRIDATPFVDEEFKRPVILMRGSHMVTLLIEAYHRHFKHQNNETVVNEMRQKFWSFVLL
jgi:hypothetical protein